MSKSPRYRKLPTVELYRSEADAIGTRDHRWRIVSANDIIADSSEGYSRKSAMVTALWSALTALLRWADREDPMRLLTLVSRYVPFATVAPQPGPDTTVGAP